MNIYEAILILLGLFVLRFGLPMLLTFTIDRLSQKAIHWFNLINGLNKG